MPRRSPIGLDGVSVSWTKDDSGKVVGCLVKVRDEIGRYQGKRFAVTSIGRDGKPCFPLAAKRWAKTLLKKFTAGTSSAGVANVLAIGQEYVKRLGDTGSSPIHASSVENTITAVSEAGMKDFKAPNFHARFHHWLSNLQGNWWPEAEKFKFRRKTKLTLSNSTKNLIIRHVRSVIHYAINTRRLNQDPLAGIKRYTVPEKLKPLFTIQEIRDMVSNENSSDKWWLPACLMIYTGCRVQEAMHLRWEWIDWESHVIRLQIHADFQIKNQRERIIPLQPELEAILKPLGKPHGWIIHHTTLEAVAGGIYGEPAVFMERMRRSPLLWSF
jgi:hypothetical protein